MDVMVDEIKKKKSNRPSSESTSFEPSTTLTIP